jgi:hypothetical protein
VRRFLIAQSMVAAVVAAVAALAAGPDVTVVPPKPVPRWTELKTPVGRQTVLSAGESAAWELVDAAGADLTPDSGGKTAVFSAWKAGRYRVLVTTPAGTSRVEVVAGDAPPPDPVVPPDPPADPLAAELRLLFAADRGKAADMQALSALYTLMVAECAKPEYGTALALNETFVESRDRMLKDPATGAVALPGVRKRCGAEVAAVIGVDPAAPLTAAARERLQAAYARLSRAVLEAAK